MQTSPDRKTFYRFAFTALLVVLLVTVFMVVFLQQKSSRRLSATMKDLLAAQTNIGAVDAIVQELYASENHFRLYTLTHTAADYRQYVNGLQDISAKLDSIHTRRQEEERLQGLLAEKQEKTAMFIRIKFCTDSLLSLSRLLDTARNDMAYTPPKRFTAHMKSRTDTIVAEYVAPQKPKKKLLGRLKDAILNKAAADKEVKREVTIIKTAQDSTGTRLGLANAQLRQISDYYENLRNKEYELVMANVQLFGELNKLLDELKLQEQQTAAKRQALLSRNFNNTLQAVDAGIWWSVALILLLTLIILFNIRRLYKKELALLHAQQAAERFAKLKSEFVTTMSHEIRTPLNAVLGLTDLLQRTPLNNDQKELMDTLGTSANMLLSVVNNILDFSRLESGRLTLAREKFAPAEVIASVVKMLQVQAGKKELQLQAQIRFSKNFRVWGDAFRLSQVLTNLVTNAIRFTDKGSVTITAAIQHTGSKALLEVTVADTGIGIAEADQAKIFEAFRQTGGSRAHQDGSGLGLAITRNIIQLHKGTIKVESAPGKGAAFTFQIPYQAAEKTGERPESPAAPSVPEPPVRAGKLRLLVVDDSLLNRKLLEVMLRKADVEFTLAADGREALRLMEERDFDMVWTDIDMPVMDGLELTRRIHTLPDIRKSSVPIIAITGNVLDEQLQSYHDAGMAGYILKPYREEDIIGKINEYYKKNNYYLSA